MEIKRVIAAAIRAGIEIGSIDMHLRKITIHSREDNESQITAYDLVRRQALGQGIRCYSKKTKEMAAAKCKLEQKSAVSV